jgi:hypothetical protein
MSSSEVQMKTVAMPLPSPSYRTAERLSKKQVQEEIVRKARHQLKSAALAT